MFGGPGVYTSSRASLCLCARPCMLALSHHLACWDVLRTGLEAPLLAMLQFRPASPLRTILRRERQDERRRRRCAPPVQWRLEAIRPGVTVPGPRASSRQGPHAPRTPRAATPSSPADCRRYSQRRRRQRRGQWGGRQRLRVRRRWQRQGFWCAPSFCSLQGNGNRTKSSRAQARRGWPEWWGRRVRRRRAPSCLCHVPDRRWRRRRRGRWQCE